ncbi:uncharacterized protein LOC112599903 [Melanaphis sacchari]|uniref:uncharacterized protein LOC112599903 n=1 Tax=Melanaphis sacchari TaxID=742174 RepID=UPI000DC14507|nr:uncharacterized protein LOC112599903 [Melanaphis sacchari]
MTCKPNDEVFQNFEDPGEWPCNLSIRERDIIIKKGLIEITDHDFPIKSSDDVVKRKFTVKHYNRILSNGEKVKRRCCEIRMKKNITIDKQNLALIRKETEHWRAVLTRILHIVHYLSERNLDFREIYSSTGENISLTILSELDTIGLNIEDCRGQGYDNGANMKGKYKGVQAKILQKNPKAFFTPLSQSKSAIRRYGKMWSISIKNIPNCTVKRLSETRRESRIESVKPIRYHTALIRDSFLEIAETTNDSTIKSEAQSLALNKLENFEFIVSVVIWYDLLLLVNSVSKLLQLSDMNLDVAVNGLKCLLKFLKNYRDIGFTSAIVDAKEIVSILKINPVFKETRTRKIKRLFTYEQDDEPINLNKTPEEKFKIEYFYQIYSNIYGFLYSPEKLRGISENDLVKCCFDLDISLRDGKKHNIDGAELFSELKILRQMIHKEINTSIEVLQFIKDLQNPFPNATVSHRILLTIPITVASAERSFSKLKLIKSYLRTSMTQERLTSLAILSIEEDIASNLDCWSRSQQFTN